MTALDGPLLLVPVKISEPLIVIWFVAFVPVKNTFNGLFPCNP